MRKPTAAVIAALAGAMFPTTGFTQDIEAGVSAYDTGDYEKALKKNRPLAEQGDADAQIILGFMYTLGRGVAKNDAEAVRWYRLAAAQGKAHAQLSLGNMYNEGRGVPKSVAEAVRWYRLAAEQGYARAQLNLGVMYGSGQGMPQNLVTAYMWVNLAVAQGYEYSLHAKNVLIKQMTSADISRAQQLSQACLARNYKGC